jgi:hypothetical protein
MEQTMQSLYKPKAYPEPMRSEMQAMSDTAIEVANRWMLGWPGRVKGLIESGEFLEALKDQEQKEIAVKLDKSLMHLSSWEKNEVMGLTDEPPYPTTM